MKVIDMAKERDEWGELGIGFEFTDRLRAGMDEDREEMKSQG